MYYYNNYNQGRQPDPKLFLKVIMIIHAAMLIGQVLFAIVAFIIPREQIVRSPSNNDPLLYVVPLVAVSCFLASNFLFNQQLGIAAGKPSLGEKLRQYQVALIIRYALLEGPSLFGIVAFLITGNMLFIGVSALIILYFIMIRPTRDKTETDLNLTFEEKAAMDESEIR